MLYAQHNGHDIYVALVESESSITAVKKAQAEVFHIDKEDGLSPKNQADYKLCVLFDGHHNPKLFGWQAH